jgi:hypothetical protein
LPSVSWTRYTGGAVAGVAAGGDGCGSGGEFSGDARQVGRQIIHAGSFTPEASDGEVVSVYRSHPRLEHMGVAPLQMNVNPLRLEHLPAFRRSAWSQTFPGPRYPADTTTV